MTQLHYEVMEGTGHYALCVHGMLSGRAQWTPNLEALGTCCRPVLVELLGHGRSPSPENETAYTPTSYVQHFQEIRAELGAEQIILIGQSLGAALTLRYALNHPDRVLAQIITNTNSSFANADWSATRKKEVGGLAAIIEQKGMEVIERLPLFPSGIRHVPDQVKTDLLADARLANPRGIAHTLRSTVPDSSVRERAAKISAPTLLVVGEREEGFRADRVYAEEVIPGLETVGLDAGHPVNLQQIADFNAAAVDFLTRCQAP